MIIFRIDRVQITGIQEPDFVWYLEHTGWEEVVFRYIFLIGMYQLFHEKCLAVLIPDIVWSLLHLVGFTWQMVACTIPLGLLLGWCMFLFPEPLGMVLCIIIHTFIGAMGYKLGIIQKWIRRGGHFLN